MRLSSATILIGTFVAAALFALVAATFTARALERTSADGVRMELDIGGLEWTDVTANGLQVEITGVAPSEAERFRAITVAAREFAPDLFIVTGPGTTLGGAVAQSLVLANWRGIGSKQDFTKHQNATPLLAGMGHADQRAWVTKGDAK